jgi:hypothetical protein
VADEFTTPEAREPGTGDNKRTLRRGLRDRPARSPRRTQGPDRGRSRVTGALMGLHQERKPHPGTSATPAVRQPATGPHPRVPTPAIGAAHLPTSAATYCSPSGRHAMMVRSSGPCPNTLDRSTADPPLALRGTSRCATSATRKPIRAAVQPIEIGVLGHRSRQHRLPDHVSAPRGTSQRGRDTQRLVLRPWPSTPHAERHAGVTHPRPRGSTDLMIGSCPARQVSWVRWPTTDAPSLRWRASNPRDGCE